MAGKKCKILALHAHPDDIELQCAGTLLLLKEKNCEIIMATMTAGDCGSKNHSRADIAKIRHAEATQAADIIGAEYYCLGFDDLRIFHDNDSRMIVTEFIRKIQPDIVLTAPPTDYMTDHTYTSSLVKEACFAACTPNYSTDNAIQSLTHLPHLYFMDSLDIDTFVQKTSFYIDISSTFETREKMLACHNSQRTWLREQHGIDEYLISSKKHAQRRGTEVGVDYAEAYIQYKGHPFPQENIIMNILDVDKTLLK